MYDLQVLPVYCLTIHHHYYSYIIGAKNDWNTIDENYYSDLKHTNSIYTNNVSQYYVNNKALTRRKRIVQVRIQVDA